MPSDIQDILFVFLVNNLSSITRNEFTILPIGLSDYIRTEVINSGGSLPFPSDLSDLLFVSELTRQNLF